MIALFVSLCVSAVFISGGMFKDTPGMALALASTASIILGVLYSAHRSTEKERVHEASDGELTLGQLKDSIDEDDLILYHENPFAPISGFFKARIGGRTVLVMERSHQV